MSRRTVVAEGEGLSLDGLMSLDEACDRFEAAWLGGEAPDLGPFLDDVSGALRPALVREIVILDIEYRLSRGEAPDLLAYRARFPADLAAVDAALARFATDGVANGTGAATDPDRSSGNEETQAGAKLPRASLTAVARAELLDAGYEVLGELGRGGMGVVYLARKVALNRSCALKMILAGAHAGPAASARFRAEAEAVARLQHPDIVQIFHVGEASGLPYLELEYLPGGSLDRDLDGTPLAAPAAARMIEVLARAIAEAHRQGIVHRDLKPANILLDAAGAPKVADFGLAKVLGADDGLTKTQTVLGSPSYMAPEQAEGRSRLVGPTTDVYALGAILYDLLAGRPPFRAATALETLELVKGTDPLPPSRLVPGLPRDVETICLKCLEKAPARRYASADALAEDLRRFRAGESILAHPAAAWVRAWKWSRRRPSLAAAIGVSAVAVALLLGGALYYNARLRDAVRQSRAAEQAAVVQRNLALTSLNQLVFDVQERLGNAAATRPLRQSLLRTAIVGLDQIASGTEASAPNLSRAVAHQKLGSIFRQMGRTEDARRQFELARRLAEDLAAQSPRDIEVTDCLRGVYAGLGELRLRADRPDEAKVYFHRVVSLAEAVAAADPRRDGARRSLLEAYFQYGRAHGFGNELGEAEALFQRMHALAERWVADEPENPRARDLLATSYRKLGDARKLTFDFPAARVEYAKAIALDRAILAGDPGNLDVKEHLGIALDDLAGVECEEHRFAEARPLFAEAARLFRERSDADVEDLDIQLRLVRTQGRLARVERDEARFAEAATLFHEAVGRLQELERDGRLAGLSTAKSERIRLLRQDLEDCEASLAAHGDLATLLSRPARERSRLLPLRVRAMTAARRHEDALAAAGALCELETAPADDAIALARGLSGCLGDLDDARWSGPPAPDRAAMRRRLADRAVAALDRSVSAGFRDLRSLEDDPALDPIRRHPGYRQLVTRMNLPAPRPHRPAP